MEREPIIKGGQGRTDAEVEQCGIVVGIVFLVGLAFAVGLVIGAVL